MIGQDYFDLRSRLGSALFALRGISAESGFGDDQTSTIDSLVGGLKDPFLFVVVGEVNVGKSTFLNALFGADLSKTGVMPTTEKIHFFKHGPELLRVPVTRTLEEVRVPLDILRDFNVVDTPGTNSIENEHQEITERFVPTADLVIFVFSAMNPWGASAWQFLEKVHKQWLRNVMFVLQQSDLREPEEIQSILAYMKRLCAQRFGREFPIFPVSAKRAYLARSSGLDRDRLLAESGFNNLEKYISGVIGGSGSRLGKLAGSLRTARQILGSIQGEFESRTGRRLERAGILRAIDADLAEQAQRAFDRLAAVTATASEDVEKAALGAREAIAGQLTTRGATQSVFREKRSVDAIEKQVRDAIVGADPERWSRAAVGLEADGVAAANQLRGQLAERLDAPAGAEMRFESGFWDEQRRRLIEEIGGIQQQVASGLEIAQGLEPVLRRSRRFAQGQIIIAVAGIAAAIALGVTSGWVAAGCVFAAAAIAVFLLGRKISKLLAEALAQADARLSAAPEALKRQLDEHLRGEAENLFERFNRAIQPVRESFAEQERRRVLLQWQIENLTRTLDGLESELGPGPVAPA